MKSLLLRYRAFSDSGTKTIWVLAGVKALVFVSLWLLQVATEDASTERIGWFIYGNDTHSYFDPIESLLDDGIYAMPTGPTAFRMPGLLPIYGPLYLIFGKSVAVHLFILVNLFLDVLSTILLFQILSTFFRKPAAFFGAFVYAIFARISVLGYIGMTETVAAFFFVLLLWLLIRWRSSQSNRDVIGISVVLAFLLFLKPVSGIFLAVVSLYVFVVEWKGVSIPSIVGAIGRASIVISIPVILLAAWTWRNYQAFDQFMPLTSAFGERSVELKFKEFCRTTGTEFQAWNGKDALAWFATPNNYLYNEEFQNTNPFSDYVFSDHLTIDTLRKIRSDWHQAMNRKLDASTRDEYDKLAYDGFDRAISTFKKEGAFHYYITSRMVLTCRLFFIDDSFSPYRSSTLPFKFIQLWFLLSYYVIVLSGLMGILLAILKRKSKLMLTLCLLSIFLLIHVWIGIVENRYLLPVIPLLMVFSGYSFNLVWDQIRSKVLNGSGE